MVSRRRRAARRPRGPGPCCRPCGRTPSRRGVRSRGVELLADRERDVAPLRRRHLVPVELAGLEVFARVADHLQEGVVRLEDSARGVGDDDADDAGLREPPEAGLARVERSLGLPVGLADRRVSELALDGRASGARAWSLSTKSCAPARIASTAVVLTDRPRDDDEREVEPALLQDAQRRGGAELRHGPVAEDHVPRLRLERGAHGRGVLDALGFDGYARVVAAPGRPASRRSPSPRREDAEGFGHREPRTAGARLVQEEPEEPQRLGRFGELREVHGLAHVGVGAQRVAAQDVLVLLGRGEDDDRQELRALVGADAAQDLQAVDLRQLQVEQDDGWKLAGISARVRSGAEEVVERGGPVARDDDLVRDAALLEGQDRQLLVAGVVFDEQDDLVMALPPTRVPET